MNDNVLIIDTSGGNGHVVLANGFESQLKKENMECRVTRRNVLKDLVPKTMGNYAINVWDTAQRTNDIPKQKKLLTHHRAADNFFYLSVFTNLLKTLVTTKPPPTRIINTQVMGLGASIQALRVFNWYKQQKDPNWKPIKMEIYMGEMPSKRACHFYEPIKRLSKTEKEHIKFVVPKLKEGNGLSVTQIKKELGLEDVEAKDIRQFPIDSAFRDLKYEEWMHGKAVDLPIAIEEHERDFFFSALGEKAQKGIALEKGTYHVEAEEPVFQLMLGSQPTERSVFTFVTTLLFLGGKVEDGAPRFHGQVLCGKNIKGKSSLFKKTCLFLQQQKKSDTVAILPVPFQSQDAIAKWDTRSKAAFTRAGLATSMQKLFAGTVVGEDFRSTDKKWEHKSCILAEVDDASTDASVEQLSHEIPLWEGGNAYSLTQEDIGVSITARNHVLKELCEQLGVKYSEELFQEYEQFKGPLQKHWDNISSQEMVAAPAAAPPNCDIDRLLQQASDLTKQHPKLQEPVEKVFQSVTQAVTVASIGEEVLGQRTQTKTN